MHGQHRSPARISLPLQRSTAEDDQGPPPEGGVGLLVRDTAFQQIATATVGLPVQSRPRDQAPPVGSAAAPPIVAAPVVAMTGTGLPFRASPAVRFAGWLAVLGVLALTLLLVALLWALPVTDAGSGRLPTPVPQEAARPPG